MHAHSFPLTFSPLLLRNCKSSMPTSNLFLKADKSSVPTSNLFLKTDKSSVPTSNLFLKTEVGMCQSRSLLRLLGEWHKLPSATVQKTLLTLLWSWIPFSQKCCCCGNRLKCQTKILFFRHTRRLALCCKWWIVCHRSSHCFYDIQVATSRHILIYFPCLSVAVCKRNPSIGLMSTSCLDSVSVFPCV